MSTLFSRRFRQAARILTTPMILIVLTGTQSAHASTVTFEAPTLVVQESATAQTYTADVLISDTNTTDLLEDYGLDLFLQSSPTFNSAHPGSSSDTNIAYGLSTGFDLNTTSVSTGGNVISNTATEPYVYDNDLPNNSNNSNAVVYGNGNYLTNTYTTALSGGGAINEQYFSDSWANYDAGYMTQTWALARIYITVAAGYAGTEYFVWNTDPAAKDGFAPFYGLQNDFYPPLDPNFLNGSITVVSDSLVPEPGALLLMACGAIGLGVVGCRRTRRHGPAS